MGKIFCLMGKSATGKDTIYRGLFDRDDIQIKSITPYTTRPIREREENGREYFFCTDADVARFLEQGRIIELRTYDTVYGPWKYFTADDGQFHLDEDNYLVIGTLESYVKLRDYFKEGQVCPIYIEVEDGERLIRAIGREKSQSVPKYEEMCRRFLADASDFSEEKLAEAGITRRFVNRDIPSAIQEIAEYIRTMTAATEKGGQNGGCESGV